MTKRVVDELEKLLSQAGRSFGASRSDIWENWLSYCTVVLETGLGPFREGRLPEDRSAIVAEEERLRRRYDAPHGNFEVLIVNFRAAFVLWYEYSSEHLCDVLGDTYMEHMGANAGAGQFFTPWNVARAMAQMAIGDVADGGRMVLDRVRAAIEKLRVVDEAAATFCEITLMVGSVLGMSEADDGRGLQDTFLRILPFISEYYEPVTVCDPTCGSGIMLLAAVDCFPRFAVRLGLVQFYGTDIAQVCVQMAHLNEMAYGLNGYGAAAVWSDLVTAGLGGGQQAIVTTDSSLVEEGGRLAGAPGEILEAVEAVVSRAGFHIQVGDGAGATQMAFGFLFQDEG